MTIKQKILDVLDKYTERLKDIVLTYNDVVNNCTTNDPNIPISAVQGKILQDQITTIQNQMSGISVLTRYIESGETVIFDIPLSTRAIAVSNGVANSVRSRFLYLDSQPSLVYVGHMNSGNDYSSDDKVSFINGNQCITITNGGTVPFSIFFLVFNGSISVRQ